VAHSHDHHGHSHGVKNYNRTFAVAVCLNLGFVVVEAVYGFLADSLALLADAGHNLSDVLGLLLAWGASYLAQREVSRRRTYGLQKTTILAAMFNALILLVAIGGIVWEALRRFSEPAEIAGLTVIVVAGIGVVINALTMMLFVAGRKEDLNIRGAFLHMAADAGISLGVAVAGAIILYTGQAWIDPVVSLLVAAVILVSTWSLLKDSVDLAIDAVPSGIDLEAVEAYLNRLPGVEGTHDLHIWGLSTTEAALTAHLVKPDARNDDALIEQASRELRDRFGINHVTLQWERGEVNCPSGASC
jgi:cobalt-zinc-cadmium efflux system protein